METNNGGNDNQKDPINYLEEFKRHFNRVPNPEDIVTVQNAIIKREPPLLPETSKDFNTSIAAVQEVAPNIGNEDIVDIIRSLARKEKGAKKRELEKKRIQKIRDGLLVGTATFGILVGSILGSFYASKQIRYFAQKDDRVQVLQKEYESKIGDFQKIYFSIPTDLFTIINPPSSTDGLYKKVIEHYLPASVSNALFNKSSLIYENTKNSVRVTGEKLYISYEEDDYYDGCYLVIKKMNANDGTINAIYGYRYSDLWGHTTTSNDKLVERSKPSFAFIFEGQEISVISSKEGYKQAGNEFNELGFPITKGTVNISAHAKELERIHSQFVALYENGTNF